MLFLNENKFFLNKSNSIVQGKSNGIAVAKMNDKDILRVVESCVRFGRPCLIENVGTELDASLDTVLNRDLFKSAGQFCMKIGDNVVPYNFDFHLFLTTKLPNPHYTPEVAVKVQLVNFTLTVRFVILYCTNQGI